MPADLESVGKAYNTAVGLWWSQNRTHGERCPDGPRCGPCFEAQLASERAGEQARGVVSLLSEGSRYPGLLDPPPEQRALEMARSVVLLEYRHSDAGVWVPFLAAVERYITESGSTPATTTG